MICQSVTLENFRNIESACVAFSPGINLIMGDNAQGKTNLLEGIALMAIGKSFRGAKEREMIRFGSSTAAVSLTYRDEVREQCVAVRLDALKRRVWTQNDNKLSKVSDMVGRFRVVVFMPEHLSIIKSGPEARRNFMDIALCQMRPRYLYMLQRYNAILKERNKLLKQAKEAGSTPESCRTMLDVWTEQLAEHAAILADYRAEFVRQTDEAAGQVFQEMTCGREVPHFIYQGPLGNGEENRREDAKEQIYHIIRRAYGQEIAVGSTLHGCHRDDIDITLNGKSARLYASQGQQRSLSLAMKLAEGEIGRGENGEYPVFLFDDVLSELDRGRRDYLISKISGRQVIMTGCENWSHLVREGEMSVLPRTVIHVQNGTFRSK